MIKTITELQPLICATMFSHPARRRDRVSRWLLALHCTAFAAYVMIAWRIAVDTELAPWDVRFWLILVPFFALGEWTLRELSRWLLPRDEW